MGGSSTFAGKFAFGSTSTTTVYLTTGSFQHKGGTLRMPIMDASDVTPTEHCILYQTDTPDQMLMQLGSLLWVSLKADLGWLVATDDKSQAVPIILTNTPVGQVMQVVTGAGNQTVYYTVNGRSSILTINQSGVALDTFLPQKVTPGLADLRQGGGKEADLSAVDLRGADLSGICFRQAKFAQANLSGATLDGGDFSQAVFAGAKLGGITANGATLDGADLSGATLAATRWGTPRSAKAVQMTGADATGAVLGTKGKPLNCTGAILTDGRFDGADLTGLVLSKAILGNVSMVGAVLDDAVLDDANLGAALLLRASLRNASLKRAIGHGANLMGADLSYANLNQAQFGPRAHLFSLPAGDAEYLNKYAFPQPPLIATFKELGATLSDSAPITVLAANQRWTIDDQANGPYDLVRNDQDQIDVFLNASNMVPATLSGALCVGTQASSAILTGADLRRVQWYGGEATLDHANLDGASLADSLLVGTKFTQAFLSGTDFSGAVLVGADFRGCLIQGGTARQPAGFDGAQLQGALFGQATLVNAVLFESGIATDDGVPLLRLPLSDKACLTNEGIATLAPRFAARGYPLGNQPTVTHQAGWLIDNSSDPDTSAPRSYRVTPGRNQLDVANGDGNTYLFPVNTSLTSSLNSGKVDAKLLGAFRQQSYTVALQAPIAAKSEWLICAGCDQPVIRVGNYPTMRVVETGDVLQVYGITLLMLRDWSAFPGGVAFEGTDDLEEALGKAVIGPSGYPYRLVKQGTIPWLDYVQIGDP